MYHFFTVLKSLFIELTGFSKKNPETPPTIGGYGNNGFKTALNFPENWNTSFNYIGITKTQL